MRYEVPYEDTSRVLSSMIDHSYGSHTIPAVDIVCARYTLYSHKECVYTTISEVLYSRRRTLSLSISILSFAYTLQSMTSSYCYTTRTKNYTC
jgi:hypothetical protein